MVTGAAGVTDLDGWSVEVADSVALLIHPDGVARVFGAARDFGSGLLLVKTDRGTFRLDADLTQEQRLLAVLEPEE